MKKLKHKTLSSPQIVMLPLSALRPNPFQPRQQFDERAIKKLVRSIEQDGLLHPILAQRDRKGHGHTILAGHLRVEAFKRLKRTAIPAIILDKADPAAIPIIENLIRANLAPIERAKSIDRWMKTSELTQAEVGKRLGRSQSSVAQLLTLLHLDESIQKALPKYRGLSVSLLEELATCRDDVVQDQLWQMLTSGKVRTVRDLRARKNALLHRPLGHQVPLEFLDQIRDVVSKLSRCDGARLAMRLLQDLEDMLTKTPAA